MPIRLRRPPASTARPRPGISCARRRALISLVLVLGLLVAVQKRMPWSVAALLAGVFAFFHGAAHGAELASDTGLMAAAALAGMALGSATLHLTGMALGNAALQRHAWIARAGGVATAALGAFMLTRLA